MEKSKNDVQRVLTLFSRKSFDFKSYPKVILLLDIINNSFKYPVRTHRRSHSMRHVKWPPPILQLKNQFLRYRNLLNILSIHIINTLIES